MLPPVQVIKKLCRTRKQKMEVWSNDVKKNLEKKETEYKEFMTIFLPYKCVKD